MPRQNPGGWTNEALDSRSCTSSRRPNVKETRMAAFAYDEAAVRRLFGELEELAGTRYPL
jgi:hypothetical protein